MGEIIQETLSNNKPFWLCPSFLMGCIRFVVSIMSTIACIVKKKVAAWKPPALTGFLSLCRKDKNNTKMDDEDMDRPIYWPNGIIPTVIRPQESHGLCVIPQPARKKDHRKQWQIQDFPYGGGGVQPLGGAWTSNMGTFWWKCMQKWKNWVP